MNITKITVETATKNYSISVGDKYEQTDEQVTSIDVFSAGNVAIVYFGEDCTISIPISRIVSVERRM